MFQPLWPSSTAGDGCVRKQYRQEWDGQGFGRKLRRVACKLCGFTGANLDRDDHSGGTYSGDGGLGDISSGNREVSAGGGCQFCGSKNYAGAPSRRDEFTQRPHYSGRLD